MRHLRVFVFALVLGSLLAFTSEAMAFASRPSATPAATGPTNTNCPALVRVETLKAQGQIADLSLDGARSCWPNARVSTDGTMNQPGEYIIPHGRAWIHAGVTVGAPVFAGRTLSSRDALAYSCGQWVGWNMHSWEQYQTYISFDTTNTFQACNYAYNNSETPYCGGFGQCLAPSLGVIGNNTYNLNPWYNQIVYYLSGNFTDTFYCRHYLTAYTGPTWSAWCS